MNLMVNEDIIEITQFGYEVIKELGRGSFGVVYLGIKQGEELAIKTIKKDKIQRSQKLTELLDSEKQLLSTIKSNHITKLFEFFETDKNCFLAMEYCNGGTLEKYIQQKKLISEKEAKGYLIQLLSGFKDLHSHLVIHRDIKLENIMRHFPNGQTGNDTYDNKNVVLKIADLGLAKEMKDEMIAHTYAGTVLTMAPEILKQKSYGFEVDVYSLGVILYYMVQGKYPFYENNDTKLLQKIKEQNIQFKDENPVSLEFQDLIKQMLKYNKKQRITWSGIINHKAIQPENQLTVSQRFDKCQNEEISSSKVGFEKISDLYEIQNKLPQYQCKQKLIPITQNNFVNNYLAIDTDNSNKLVIVKQVISDYYTLKEYNQTADQIKQVFKIIQKINQENILKINLITMSKNKFYIVSEYLKYGNLQTINSTNKKFLQQEILLLLINILISLKWLHENGIIHRNINLKSIYIAKLNESINFITQFKLGGFKNCYKFEQRSSYAKSKYKGMNFYTAPEILSDKIYTQTVDIYSLGVVLHELVYGYVPYIGNTKQELIDNIYNQRKNHDTEVEGFSKELLELIEKMIIPDPKQRINFEQLWSQDLIIKYLNKKKDIALDIQNFYQQQSSKYQFQVSKYVSESSFQSLLQSKFEFSQEKICLSNAPEINYFKRFKFKYNKYAQLFIDKDSNFPDDLKINENSTYCIKAINSQQKNIEEFLEKQQKKNQINLYEEDLKFIQFNDNIKILIEKAKQSLNFELCIYYSQVKQELALKKSEFDQTKDINIKMQILKELNTNYEKINIKS
ncbi:Serine/Threonine kinase domain protein (macronuclear) [Tetrahymena thermophila SB210]|uniref:Serine/Threonine kinase domain protein n=1 Tax=Tetrahymena thermophila (strain SB210) TaxID=312017 RepID=I7MK36_TETTS|nr:Serine/Threonine kinase domain protein [Tetrahymena thermophila SB210]EAS07778.1 Serine/Threonine kinase domain protein [Tetrahymena thermophila SB210]|eukprot:XP_001028020.1 Serine/Threonine kinase domain protein [Tetrahymena thermophila SB210]